MLEFNQESAKMSGPGSIERIYRGPDFIAVVWFGSLLPLSPVIKLDRVYTRRLRKRDNLLMGEGGGGGRGAESESLALYISFNTLWDGHSDSAPPHPSPLSVSKLSLFLSLPVWTPFELTDGRGVGKGWARSQIPRNKAWSSVNHSVLSGPEWGLLCQKSCSTNCTHRKTEKERQLAGGEGEGWGGAKSPAIKPGPL
jgi:hypothetical protein